MLLDTENTYRASLPYELSDEASDSADWKNISNTPGRCMVFLQYEFSCVVSNRRAERKPWGTVSTDRAFQRREL
jgi:hypothetical protein